MQNSLLGFKGVVASWYCVFLNHEKEEGAEKAPDCPSLKVIWINITIIHFFVFQRKPLRPSSVQNLRKTQQQTIAPPKKILPPNPIVRQTNGSSPPVRPYSVPNEGKDHPHRALEVVQNSEQSWSPQPFRNSEVMEDARRDTFVVARKETFSEHSMASTASPRRETFIVPKSTNVHDEVIVNVGGIFKKKNVKWYFHLFDVLFTFEIWNAKGILLFCSLT